MLFRRVFILVCVVHCCYLQEITTSSTFSETKEGPKLQGEKKISDVILEILEHYKHPDPLGLPGSNVPDPYPVPDMRKSLTFGTIYFKNSSIHGTSKFRINYIEADIENLEVRAELLMDQLLTQGDYTYCQFMCLKQVSGQFTVNVTNLNITGKATLGIKRNGSLRAEHINMDIKFNKISLNFENLGFFGNVIQGFINSLSIFIFESIKPYILDDSYVKIRRAINKKLDEVVGDIQFPNTIAPLDMVIVDARNKIQDIGLDPLQIKDCRVSSGIFGLSLSDVRFMGLSSFYRIGNISVRMVNNTLEADLELGVKKLKGTAHWYLYSISGIVSLVGTVSLEVEYIKSRVIIAQPLNTLHSPELREFKIDVGNIQARCDGAGTLDYVVEFAVNVIPNLLRLELLDTLKGPIRLKVQDELNSLNVEELIRNELPRLDEIEASGLKLSSLRTVKQFYDEDEFFNF